MKYTIPADRHMWRFGRFTRSWEQLRSTRSVTYAADEYVPWSVVPEPLIERLTPKIRPCNITEIAFFRLPHGLDYEFIAVEHRHIQEVATCWGL